MSATESVKVGKIIDAHALKGEVYFLSFANDITWLEEGHELTLESYKVGGQKNFTVSAFRPFKEGALIKFEGIDSRNQSEELKGAIVYIHEDNFVSDEGETIYLREVLGFAVTDEQGQSLGKVKDFSSNGMQDLLIINNGKFSYEVPFVDDFIVEIQFENSTIVMNFPLDLMDINRVV